ncbi:MAG: hypothetical protein NVS2B7_12820 [Herpetosiphon sp.]
MNMTKVLPGLQLGGRFWIRWTEGAGLLLLALVAAYISSVNVGHSYDDAFITYRYAYNLATGQGFVYNVGEAFLGTTAPLYGILLGVLGFLRPNAIPTLSGYICALSLFMTGAALFMLGRQHNSRFAGFLAGLFFIANPIVPSTFGGEMLMQVALVAWAFVLYDRQATRSAAVILAIAILLRADSVLAAVPIGLHFVASKRRLPLREIGLMVAIILPFMLSSWLFYGSLLPGTLAAKLAQRDSGLWPPFTRGIIEWFKALTIQGWSKTYPSLQAAPHAIRFIPFVIAGVPALYLYRFWLRPLGWVCLYWLGYHVLNVPFYHWYTIPIVFGAMILAGSGVAVAVELVIWLARSFVKVPVSVQRTVLTTVVCVLLAPGLINQVHHSWSVASHGLNPVERLYTKTGTWLQEHTEPSARVGYFEIGYVGYFSHRPIIDPLALVNPDLDLAPHVARRELTWAYKQYRPEYIIQNQMIFLETIGTVTKEAWFKKEYKEVAVMTEPGWPSKLVIYHRTAASQ